ncbi:succinate dehydrogenase, cytochrome b556 subunit [Neisseria sp. N95_16]|uniref:Succinate dehydrogenase cytochrome b556 subunit n=1 Tax=Neisseria brasiliensis TaxID=2666100 RepID=A0A5Q3S5F8_9NEIS|nr:MULTISPECIES: succinate dehydrogenase, cytochrome b556 subunit [Neisseria]MRN37284.1 succinate dehydrogenase, cytochrome b556 subunit [Neisseria brasiliensis]PJO10059.1 succinate dehydrogenase, cytochrome b556 subunit [Neisseria sp. N95_16]PJO78297.1 succinate dehydrogenase, cytochrome b556 subunit [Neisseria sp. N177_16]QGL25718.1 succinate dehydrogenase, cytochrome b556 subunit [Neisseria brasiliensis]
MSAKPRPVFLEIPNIRLPIPGIVSILHRVSGVVLFVALPVLLYLLSGTLSQESDFEAYRAFVANPLVKLALIGLLWAYLHHSLAGIRFLLLDAHKGLELNTARNTAKLVFIAALVLTVVIGALLW